MRPDVVVLADAGHVRDGLLFVIGGGIDQMYSASLPAIIQATIVAKVILDPGDLEKEHVLKLTVKSDGEEQPIAEMSGKFFVKRSGSVAIDQGFATAIKLDGLALPNYGVYSMLLEVDATILRDFRVTLSERTALRRRSTDSTGRARATPTIKSKPKRLRKG